MAIAKTVEEQLQFAGIVHRVIAHPRTETSSQTSEAAHVPGDRLAKAVVLHGDQGFTMVVAPSTHRLDLTAIAGAERLATEHEIARLFPDCEVGAVPPLGTRYGVPTIVDESLRDQPEIWFEAGDHEHIVGLSASDFAVLIGSVKWVRLASHLPDAQYETPSASTAGGDR